MKRQPWDISRQMFLNQQELEALLVHVRALDGERGLADRLIIEGLVFSGLRCSEFCQLRATDTILGRKASVFIVQGEREAGRTVHVPAAVSRLVREYWRVVRSGQGVSRGSLVEPLLLNEREKPYERTGLYRRVVAILSAAGLEERASVQLLRHTYGYLAYLKTGGNLLFVQRQMGHAHPMVTSIYAQFVAESYSDLAELVSGQRRLQVSRSAKPRMASRSKA